MCIIHALCAVHIYTHNYPVYIVALLPSWVIDWDTVYRLGHSPIQAVHNMLCTAWIGKCPNLRPTTVKGGVGQRDEKHWLSLIVNENIAHMV